MTQTPVRVTYYPSRPRLRIDNELKQTLGDSSLLTLMVEETTLGLFRCEASFGNWGPREGGVVGYLFFDSQTLDFGKTFSVEFGPPGESGPVFAGRISGIEASFPADREPEILILAEDRFQDLRMERRTRTFEDMTDADIIRQVTSQNNLTAQVDVDGPTHRLVAQVNQSDLAFLRERASAVDAEMWIDNRTLYTQARSRRNHGSVTFTYGRDLVEFHVLADLAQQRSAVRVSGWDVGNKEAIDVQADRNTIQSELGDRRSGSSVLQALTAHTERIASSEPLSRQEAQSLAEARYRQRARSFVRGEGIAEGTPRLRVGTTIELRNIGPYFEGPYYVTLARHTFDPLYGYRTHFQVERPGLGGAR